MKTVLGRIHIAVGLLLCALAIDAAPLHMFYANTSAWKSERVFIAESDVVSAPSQLLPSVTVKAGTEELTTITTPGFGVSDVDYGSGDMRVWTEAAFDDGQTTNSIEIPPLPDALGASGFYSFEGIRSGAGRSTYIALVSDNPTAAILDVYDGANRKIASEGVSVSGFTFYKVQTSVTIGRAELRLANGFNFGWPVNAHVYAVAFVGRDSGKPRVEVPRLH